MSMSGVNYRIQSLLAAPVEAVRGFAPGYKTYLSALGLLVVAGVQAFYLKDPTAAFQTLMNAFGLLGLRSALPR